MIRWEKHKPRVWRLRGQRCRVTVAPSLVRREWIWAVDRSNRMGTFELAHGRAPRLEEAKEIGAAVLAIIDIAESRRNRERYLPRKQAD